MMASSEEKQRNKKMPHQMVICNDRFRNIGRHASCFKREHGKICTWMIEANPLTHDNPGQEVDEQTEEMLELSSLCSCHSRPLRELKT